MTAAPAPANPYLAAAASYAASGWHILPLKPRGKTPLTPHGVKDATTDQAALAAWWKRWPQANVGIACGPSGLLVLDVDPRNDGDAALRALEHQHGPLPETPVALTGGGGTHYLFHNPDARRSGSLAPGLDLKGDGGYIVAPPSVHPSGRAYEWEVAHHPDDMALAAAPAWVLNGQAASATAPAQPPPTAADRIAEGQRNATLTSLAGTMRRRGMSPQAIEAALLAENAARCNPPLPDDEVRAVAGSVASYAPPAPAEGGAGENGQVRVMPRFYPRPFAADLMQRYRFLATSTTSRGDFYIYDNRAGIWRADAADFVTARMRRADLLVDEQKKRYAIDEIVADVRGLAWQQAGLPMPDPHLIPCANGVYDLRADSLRPFTAEDGFTWKLPHRYNPDARSEFVSAHLSNFADGVQSHFWDLLAYALWRGYPYQRFWLWHGRGANGKTFLSNTLRYALGVQNVAGLTLADIQTNRFAAAALYGKLANIAGEVAYSDLENTDLLKKLTGDDWLQCERKYRDPVPFRNHAKLIFLTNAVPTTRDTTDAFYRRAFLVPFEQQFAEDANVLNRLALLAASPEGAGEFEWLLHHAVRTLRELLGRAFVFTGHQSAEETRRLYERLSNPLRQFIEERCERTYRAEDFIHKHEFQERLSAWLRERGQSAYSSGRLGRDMTELNITSGQRGEGKRWSWVGLQWKGTLA